ncbi:MAG TPA: GAF domain-containing sensor histidine kinase, partial [Gemmatimonadaceae bacterium]
MPKPTRILTHQRFQFKGDAPDSAIRELMAVREIAHAFLHADRPAEVFQFALERVSPLVGATFASIYLVDGTSDLMRLVASYNWPERYRPWLGQMRVRLGHGPSGEAAAERRVIEVPDVSADTRLEDWREVAEELGFRSLVALPLQSGNRLLGTVAFYYEEPGARSTEARNLLRIVADQMAATAEKAAMLEQMRSANIALTEANEELERQYAAVVEARKVKDEFLANISHELRTPLTAVMGYVSLLQEEHSGPLTSAQRADLERVTRASERLLEVIDDLLELTVLKRGAPELVVEDVDAVSLLRHVMATTDGRQPEVTTEVQSASASLSIRTDRRKLTRLLGNIVGNAYKFTTTGSVKADAEIRDNRIVFRVTDTGIGIPVDAQRLIFDEFRQVDGSATRQYGGSGLGLS